MRRRLPLPSAPALALAVALQPGCASNPVSVREVEPASTLRSDYSSALSGPVLSEHSRQVLGTLGLLDVLDRDPLSVPPLVCDDAFLVPGWLRALASAEVLYLQAHTAESESGDPGDESARTAAALYLESALIAYEGVLGEHRQEGSPWDPRRQLTLEIYNRALARFLTLRQRTVGHPATWTSVEGAGREFEIEVTVGEGDWDPRFFDTFVAADALETRGLRHRHRYFGLGAPLVAVHENALPERPTEPHFPPEGRVYPATAVLRPAGGLLDGGTASVDRDVDGQEGRASTRLALSFRNPFACHQVVCDGSALPLAADITAPYAYLLARANLHELEDLGLFDVDAAEFHRGMFFLEPYNPDKIPLVLVHGLWSSPLTWRELTNEVWGDPALRERYQIWHYMYATGTPVLDAALGLREALRSSLVEFDPEGDDLASRDVVLIGHSMGGLLSKVLVQSSGERVWAARFRKPLEELDLSPEMRRYAHDMFHFEPEPAVRRVIFIAVPHHGSETADSFIGRLGSSMIRLPARIAGFARSIADHNPDASNDAVFEVPTSVDVLSPRNPVLAALAELPIVVPFHSIVGDATGRGLEAGSDGVVPSASARLAGAESELVVPAGHDAHMHPLAIAEVRRILRAHVAREDAPVVRGQEAHGRR